MLFDTASDTVRLTKEERAFLARKAAEKGLVIGEVKNASEAMSATLDALPHHLADDLLQYLETGSSPLTGTSSPEQFEAQLSRGASEE